MLRHISEPLAALHRRVLQHAMGRVFGKLVLLHQQRLGAINQLALVQRPAGFFQFDA